MELEGLPQNLVRGNLLVDCRSRTALAEMVVIAKARRRVVNKGEATVTMIGIRLWFDDSQQRCLSFINIFHWQPVFEMHPSQMILHPNVTPYQGRSLVDRILERNQSTPPHPSCWQCLISLSGNFPGVVATDVAVTVGSIPAVIMVGY